MKASITIAAVGMPFPFTAYTAPMTAVSMSSLARCSAGRIRMSGVALS